MIPFEPYGDRVIIRPIVSPERTEGGVFMPETARYLVAEGDVLAIGDGTRLPSGELIPLRTKIGDRVRYTPYAGNPFKLDGEDVISLSERDILGRIPRVPASA